MKKLAIRCLSALAGLCLAAAAVFGLNGGLRATAHRELAHRMADARTMIAAVRYLLEPEWPDTRPNPTEWQLTMTNAAKTAWRPPLNRSWSQPTNLPNLTISNGVVATQTDVTTPG